MSINSDFFNSSSRSIIAKAIMLPNKNNPPKIASISPAVCICIIFLPNVRVDAPAVTSLNSTTDVIAGCISRLVGLLWIRWLLSFGNEANLTGLNQDLSIQLLGHLRYGL